MRLLQSRNAFWMFCSENIATLCLFCCASYVLYFVACCTLSGFALKYWPPLVTVMVLNCICTWSISQKVTFNHCLTSVSVKRTIEINDTVIECRAAQSEFISHYHAYRIPGIHNEVVQIPIRSMVSQTKLEKVRHRGDQYLAPRASCL